MTKPDDSYGEKENKVSKRVEEISQWFVKFPKTSPTRKIIMLIAVITLFLNSVAVNKELALLKIDYKLPAYYSYVYLAVLILLYLCAVLYRRKEIKIEQKNKDISKVVNNSYVKGLFSFTGSAEDINLFQNLERNIEISNYLNSITHPTFRIGLLTAPSGIGKTSLLQAGLAPAIRMITADQGKKKAYACLVVICSNKELMAIIKRSIVDQFGINISLLTDNLKENLRLILEKSAKKYLVIILDQFEQFYIHKPLLSDRSFFNEQLKQIHDESPEVKILIGIRSDYLDSLHELQEELKYTLSSKNYFALKRLTPEQTARIFKLIAAESGNKDVNISFLERVARENLAATDGLITPVNIQIVALVIQSMKEGDFDESTFNKLGGIDGILQKYIQDQLGIATGYDKDTIIQLLLGLINKKNNLKIGRLTLEELKDKVVSDHKDTILKILKWLEEIRLVHVINGAVTEYELAHDRLAEPIRNIYLNTNLGLRKANDILERRTSQFLEENRNPKFLLSIPEYYLITKHESLINWEPNGLPKRELLKRSLRSYVNWSLVIGLPIFLLFLWLSYLRSNFYFSKFKINPDLEAFFANPANKKLKLELIDSIAIYDCPRALEICRKYHISLDDTATLILAATTRIKNKDDFKFTLQFLDTSKVLAGKFKLFAYCDLTEKYDQLNAKERGSLFNKTMLIYRKLEEKDDGVITEIINAFGGYYFNQAIALITQLSSLDAQEDVYERLVDDYLNTDITKAIYCVDKITDPKRRFEAELKVISATNSVKKKIATVFIKRASNFADTLGNRFERIILQAELTNSLKDPDLFNLELAKTKGLLSQVNLNDEANHELIPGSFIRIFTNHPETAFDFIAFFSNHIGDTPDEIRCYATLAVQLKGINPAKSKVCFSKVLKMLDTFKDDQEEYFGFNAELAELWLRDFPDQSKNCYQNIVKEIPNLPKDGTDAGPLMLISNLSIELMRVFPSKTKLLLDYSEQILSDPAIEPIKPIFLAVEKQTLAVGYALINDYKKAYESAISISNNNEAKIRGLVYLLRLNNAADDIKILPIANLDDLPDTEVNL
jgi:hypothetical protein